MSIKRAPRPQGNFYILDKSISEDKRLTWSARGLLVYLLGKPDHWQVSVQALINETEQSRTPSGRDAVRALVTELITAGYIKRSPARDAEGKMLGYEYTVTEAWNQPETGQPETGNPAPAKTPLVRTDSKARTDSPTTGNGTRLPSDWHLTEECRAYCQAKRPDLDPEETAENFRDFWSAKPGKDGRKLDWAATWRTWVRNQRVQALPIASKGRQAPMKSFQQQEREAGWARWEAMTGRVHPDRIAAGGTVIDVPTLDSSPALLEDWKSLEDYR